MSLRPLPALPREDYQMNRNATLRVCTVLAASLIPIAAAPASSSRLPDGTEVQSWEKPLTFSKTYYVDGAAANADDNGPGSKERPFRTVNKAAQVLQPGERVVIAAGVYREFVNPARGGTGPGTMIGYEAAPGAKVVIKGSALLNKGWTENASAGRGRGGFGGPGAPAGPGGTAAPAPPAAHIWQIDISPYLRDSYNPFAMVNAPGDRYWLNYKVISLAPYFRRRGMIFVDGKPLEQVDSLNDLVAASTRSTNYYEEMQWHPLFEEIGGGGGKYWVDQRGTTIHVRLPHDDSPDKHVIEGTVQEQVFAPTAAGLGYIRIKGISFQHSGDPFPMPQSAVVATHGGNHWIIEDNSIEWANGVCLAVGMQNGGGGGMGASATPSGSHIVRNNTIRYCGIGGIEGLGAGQVGVIEKNLIEWVGWQDAEREWEAGAVKLHGARNLLFRNNVIRHIRFAAGFWLDVSNVNTRATGNIIADVVSVSGAIHIEGTHEQNQIDNNIIWGVKNSEPSGGGQEGAAGSCIFAHGTDKLVIVQNLLANCTTTGVYAVPIYKRIVGTRGGTARDLKVYNNLFYSWGAAAIGFANEHNQADGNLYLLGRGFGGSSGGYLRILAPEPPQYLDVAAGREFYGWEKNGSTGGAEELTFDVDKLTMTLVPRGDWPKLPLFNAVDTDLFGAPTEVPRTPGPFGNLEKGFRQRNIDPRQH
jgi:hypothetical protein